jgi:hypothetical protein
MDRIYGPQTRSICEREMARPYNEDADGTARLSGVLDSLVMTADGVVELGQPSSDVRDSAINKTYVDIGYRYQVRDGRIHRRRYSPEADSSSSKDHISGRTTSFDKNQWIPKRISDAFDDSVSGKRNTLNGLSVLWRRERISFTDLVVEARNSLKDSFVNASVLFDFELDGLLTPTNYLYLQNEIAAAGLRTDVEDWLKLFVEGTYRDKKLSLHVQSTMTINTVEGGRMKRMYLSSLMYGVSAISWTEFFSGGAAALIFSCFAIDVLD